MDRHEHMNLAGEHKFTDTGQAILIPAYIAVWALDSFVLKFSTGLSAYVPLYLRIPAAAILFTAAVLLGFRSHNIIFGTKHEKPGVMSHDVYRYARHPMYLGSMLSLLALFALTLPLASLAVFAVVFVFYNYVSGEEEKLLAGKLGDEYRDYIKKVPKFGLRF